MLKINRDEYQLFGQNDESLLHEEHAITHDVDGALNKILSNVNTNEGAALDVQISNSEVLMREVSMPESTEENLYQVIQYEMDRYTPFRNEDVFFDYRVEERIKDKQLIKVLLIVVRKEVLNPVINALENSNVHLRNINIVDLDNADVSLENVKLLRDYADIGKNKKSPNKWLMATAAGLLLLTAITPIVMSYVQINKLKSELKDLEGTVQQVKQLQNESAKMQEQVGYLVKIKEQNPSVIEMLDLLTKVIPDHTYVQRLSLEGGVLSLRGSSASASDLIPIIDQTGLFSDIRFAAPVTQTGGNGLENYSISANVKSLHQPEQS